MMRFGSVCSGIEAASMAWEPLGWAPAWFAEIEPFPSAVLAHHWPTVPNLGDMTQIHHGIADGTIKAPDILVGGTPCQAFSIAGLRSSLEDSRGQLTLHFVGLANAIDTARQLRNEPPAVVVWENVPGVLTTHDNAFGCFLGALAGEDVALLPPGGKWTNAGVVVGPARTIAWRVLDAQYFGVAQRRRRVFVVASAGGIRPEQVLFEFDGVRRDSPPSREAGQGFARVAGTLTSNRGGLDRPAGNANKLDFCIPVNGSHWDGGPHPSLNQSNNIGGVGMSNQEIFSQRGAYLAPHPVAPCLQAGGKSAGSATQQDAESGALVVQAFDLKGGLAEHGNPKMQGIAFPIKASDHKDPQLVTQVFGGNRTSGPIEVSPALNACGTASGRQDFETEAFVVEPRAWAIQERAAHPNLNAGPGGKGYQEGVSYTLEARHHVQACAVTVAFQPGNLSRGAGAPPSLQVFPTLKSDHGRGLSDQHQHVAVAFSSKDYGADAGEILRLLREEVGEEAFAEWRSRVLDSLQRPEVLQSPLYGPGLRQAPREEEPAVDDGPLPRTEAVPSIRLRDLWENGPDRRTSQGLRLEEQLRRKLGQALPSMPPQGASRTQVRRLTPTEAERLQGFPDGHTLIPWRGKPAELCPDGPRYKALGNSMCVDVMRWIGKRISAAVES